LYSINCPDDDDAESAGAGSGVTRTGPEIKVRGLAPKKPGSPATTKLGAPATKTPAKPATAKVATPSPRPVPVAAKPKTPVATPAKPTEVKTSAVSPPGSAARGKSPAARAGEAKPAWGSTKASEKKAPPAVKPGAAKPEQKVSVGIKYDTNADGDVAVTLVNPDTAAARAGLQVGDILKSMAGKNVGNKEDFKAILPTLTPGSTVDIAVKRGADDVALKISF